MYNPTLLGKREAYLIKGGAAVKEMWTFLQTFLAFLCTVTVVLANEPKPAEGGGEGYNATYVVWYALIGIILAWGVYDSFFRPID